MAEAINSSISPYRTSCGAEEADMEITSPMDGKARYLHSPVIGAIACVALGVAVRWRVPLLPSWPLLPYSARHLERSPCRSTLMSSLLR